MSIDLIEELAVLGVTTSVNAIKGTAYANIAAINAAKIANTLQQNTYLIPGNGNGLNVTVTGTGTTAVLSGSGSYPTYAELLADSAAGNLPIGAYYAIDADAMYAWNGVTLSPVDGATVVPLLPGTGNAAANSAAIQAALNGGGTVELFAQGPIYMAVMAEIPNHTTVVLGDGLELRQATSVPFCFFTNSHWNSTPLAVTSITSTIITGAVGLVVKRVQTVVTYSETPDVLAGDGILIKGDTTGYYNGIWEVGSVSGNAVTFYMSLGGSNAAPANGAGTMTATRSNINCRVTGRGKLNGEYISLNKTAANDYGDYAMMWNNCLNPVLDGGVKFYDTAKGGLMAANCQNPVSSGLEFNLNTAGDCVHYYGPMFGYPVIESLTGTSGDDGAVFDTACENGYTQWFPPNAGGSFYGGGRISRINLHHGGNSADVVLYCSGGLLADNGFRMFGTYTIEDIQQQLKNNSNTNGHMTNHAGFVIGGGYVPQNGGVEHVVLKNVTGSIILMNATGGNISVDSVTIDNHSNPVVGDYGGITVGDNMTIGKLTVIDSDYTNAIDGGSGNYITFLSTTFEVGTLNIIRPKINNLDTTYGYTLFGGFTANGGTLGSVVIDSPSLGNHCFLLGDSGFAPSGVVPVSIRDAYNLPSDAYPISPGTGSWDINVSGASATSPIFNFYGTNAINLSFSGIINTATSLFINVEANLTLINPENYLAPQRATPSTSGTVSTHNMAGYQRLIVAPAGTIAALTLDLPANPINGEVLEMTFTQAVTALTVSGGTMTGIGSGVAAGFGGKWIYSAADTKWLMFS